VKAKGIRVKVDRCDNAKEQMVPLKKMCWEHGIMVEYISTEWKGRKTISNRS
jgi:hypothetical protein